MGLSGKGGTDVRHLLSLPRRSMGQRDLQTVGKRRSDAEGDKKTDHALSGRTGEKPKIPQREIKVCREAVRTQGQDRA
jgi:hypothetical protein